MGYWIKVPLYILESMTGIVVRWIRLDHGLVASWVVCTYILRMDLRYRVCVLVLVRSEGHGIDQANIDLLSQFTSSGP